MKRGQEAKEKNFQTQTPQTFEKDSCSEKKTQVIRQRKREVGEEFNLLWEVEAGPPALLILSRL